MSSTTSRRVGWHLVGVLVLVGIFAASVPASGITYGTIEYGHPYVGAMIVDISQVRPDLGIIEFCSGTLVSAKVFLTAGHCTDLLVRHEIPVNKVWVSFDVNIWQNPKSWRSVAAYMNHPDYNWGPTSDPHDEGVLVLAKAVKGIDPATLAPLNYLDQLAAAGKLKDARFINVGYGSDESFQVDGWRKISYSGFLSLHNAWLYMSQNINAGSAGTCFGDSGGPTFYNDGTTEYLVATVSWGDAMCVATNINYRADIASSLSFIQSVIASSK